MPISHHDAEPPYFRKSFALAPAKLLFRPANVSHAKLRGQGRAATRPAARWLLPCVLASAQKRICSHRDAERVLFGPGGSAAGPKPGRDGFSVELAGGFVISPAVQVAAACLCLQIPLNLTPGRSPAQPPNCAFAGAWPMKHFGTYNCQGNSPFGAGVGDTMLLGIHSTK